MSENLEKTFSVTSPARLSVNNIRGSVEIHPGKDGVILVTATKQPHSGDEKRTEIEITQEADGTVKAATHFPDGGWTWLYGSHPCEVDYVVKAPRQCSLKLNSVSNTVLAEGFEGDTSVNSVSGEITLRDLKGPIRIRTVSGEADGERIAGSIDLDTVSGDVVLKESTLSSIKANSVSGDMRIRTPLAEGPYDFKSVSGQVRLIVPPDTHCTGELHSLSGDLVSAFPTSGSSHHHGSQVVNVQGGGVKISLHSVSGDLSLDCDGEIPPAPEPLKTASIEERRSVLERVERGELTVDEALGQLHA
ncbi:MAG: DUF4097 family beta strand repeat-containing protein [Chloroflexi bacterium]|nr:DUF4097 family beta strand repeat-containing protein [Chloroflexota bacterium]